MKFVLHQITRRAGGGEIVRTRDIPAPEPVIGRGSDCDIHLADLVVSLHHAILRAVGPGRVAIEALGTVGFEANGAFVDKAEFAVADMPKFGFGNHVLTLSQGEQADEVRVTVAVRENQAETIAQSEQHDAFSLKTALFSMRRLAWIGGLLILAICLALPVAQFLLTHNQKQIATAGADRQWSSGPLSPGHQFLEKNCGACHQQAFVAVRDAACLACHQDGLNKSAALLLASEMRTEGSPFASSSAHDHAPPDRWRAAIPQSVTIDGRVNDWFSRSFNHPNNRCASCHTEHVGTGKTPAPGRTQTPPPVTPEEITRTDCVACHAALDRRLADTKLPNVSDWGHHPDFRPLVTVYDAGGRPRLERIALVALRKENPGLKFSHQLHLLANGGVARLAEELGKAQGYGAPLTCASCHRPDAGGKGFAQIEMTRNCSACHSLAFARVNGVLQMLPHGQPDRVVAALRTFYAQEANAPSGSAVPFTWRPGIEVVPNATPGADRVSAGVHAAFAPVGICYTCHTIRAPADPRSLAFGIAPVHLTSRYLPDDAFDHSVPAHHVDAKGAPNCDSCHRAKDSGRAEDVLLPHIAECDTCHGRSRQQTTNAARSDCAECHGFHDTGNPMPMPLRDAELARNQATEK